MSNRAQDAGPFRSAFRDYSRSKLVGEMMESRVDATRDRKIVYYLKEARNSAGMWRKPHKYVLFGRSPSTFVDKVLLFR
jgi:hypothetical protein